MVAYLFIIVIIILLLVGLYYQKNIELFTNSTFMNTNTSFNKSLSDYDIVSDSVIPLKIFQTWNTKLLPIHMKKNCKRLQEQNPQFEYFLFDDDDCLEFIETHFDQTVVDAFNSLVPGAYKADLWRYCVLYIHGGIYLDMKMRCMGDFRLIELTKQEHYVKDRDSTEFIPKHFGIYNAVMVQRPKNPLMMDCIKQIIKNIKHNEYGFGVLYPTGPGMLGLLYEKNKNKYDLPDIDMFHESSRETIRYKNRLILEHYEEYRKEQLIHQTDLHYSALWAKGSIYIL
jgi:mannosyltransferase OCH1-like enzyme